MFKNNIEILLTALFVVVVVYYFWVNNGRNSNSEHLTDGTNITLSNEAIQTMGSVLNTGNGTINNLTITGTLKVGTTLINADGSIKAGGTTVINADGSIKVGNTVIGTDGIIKTNGLQIGAIGDSVTNLKITGTLTAGATTISQDGTIQVGVSGPTILPSGLITLGDTQIGKNGAAMNNLTVHGKIKTGSTNFS